MPKILNIETGTSICSVALSQGRRIIALRESDGDIAHAVKLSTFIDEIMNEEHLQIADLDAIAISEGPGSYTGMRIGVSTAKGLCFGANKPLIAVGSLQSLTKLAIEKTKPELEILMCPMIDARRMEVYTALFDNSANMINQISAQIVNENTYSELLKTHKIMFFGNGAEKCKSVINSTNAIFVDIKASAKGMIDIASEKFAKSDFVDIAYFEPLYLKDFVVTKSKKNPLQS
ncbi:MAG: tRNA (adenosine(37)-N6)-threonylcarbamoyltransferase complex dimerization subunit type 1 TsaB [Prevotellaceae bacterium]|jgi:tRNA threonylcarbamoyladenosine biosynthesis protein TsaB|nr:tRNA (adenosine(37)-N6)-threonylcarbamoyltransferase complex dimerization subunit type 1 TsaB [Prevotellaceae bacterium]